MQLTTLAERARELIGVSGREGRPLKARDLFPQDLIVHFSYHKCVTFYYKRIMDALQKEFGFYYHSCNAKSDVFNEEALTRSDKRILTLSDTDDIKWAQLPPFKGSHFIRDPRDLIVSGYHYHLWTKEEWCRKPNYSWGYLVAMPEFEYVTTNPEKFPRQESYQEYLNTLEPEPGMILELLWRMSHFKQMRRWDFHRPQILEMRYEVIIGNERASFERLFTHYGFHPRLRERGLELVEELSLKNQSRGERDHLRNGEPQQWEQEFTPLVRHVFKLKYGDLLMQLGYASDMNW